MIRNLLMSVIAATVVLSSFAQGAFAASAGAAGNDLITLTNQLRLHPADLQVRRKLVQVMISKGMTVRAAEQIQLVMSVSGANVEDLTTLGDAQRYSGDFRHSIETYKRALQISPLSSRTLIGLAQAYAAAGDSNTAMEICRTSISQATDNNAKQDLTNTYNAIQQNAALVAANVGARTY